MLYRRPARLFCRLRAPRLQGSKIATDHRPPGVSRPQPQAQTPLSIDNRVGALKQNLLDEDQYGDATKLSAVLF